MRAFLILAAIVVVCMAIDTLASWQAGMLTPPAHGYSVHQRHSMDRLVRRVKKQDKGVLYQTEAQRLAGIDEVFNAGRR
jgi:hypothetical protein